MRRMSGRGTMGRDLAWPVRARLRFRHASTSRLARARRVVRTRCGPGPCRRIRTTERVRVHVWTCVPAHDVERHIRQLRPMRLDDEEPGAAETRCTSVVAPVRRSAGAVHKARTPRTIEGAPVQGFHTLLQNLATVYRNTVTPRLQEACSGRGESRPCGRRGELR